MIAPLNEWYMLFLHRRKAEPEFGKWKHNANGCDSGCKLPDEFEDIKINQAAVDSSESTEIILAKTSESACASGDLEIEAGGLDKPLSHSGADQQNKGAVKTDNISECAHPTRQTDAVSGAIISETGIAESSGDCTKSYISDSAEEGFVAVDALKQKLSVSDTTVDSEHDVVDQKYSVYEQTCESNLLDHIMKTQACVEERLDLLERQVAGTYLRCASFLFESKTPSHTGFVHPLMPLSARYFIRLTRLFIYCTADEIVE
jgi:hypothetical protein